MCSHCGTGTPIQLCSRSKGCESRSSGFEIANLEQHVLSAHPSLYHQIIISPINGSRINNPPKKYSFIRVVYWRELRHFGFSLINLSLILGFRQSSRPLQGIMDEPLQLPVGAPEFICCPLFHSLHQLFIYPQSKRFLLRHFLNLQASNSPMLP